jgi:beta-alanine degradation protein BauB
LGEVNVLKQETDVTSAVPVSKILSENAKVRVVELVAKPGDVAKLHSHPDHVVYVVRGGMASLTSDGKTQEIELKAGTATFFNATQHEMKNAGTTTVDLIIVEIKKQNPI